MMMMMMMTRKKKIRKKTVLVAAVKRKKTIRIKETRKMMIETLVEKGKFGQNSTWPNIGRMVIKSAPFQSLFFWRS